MNRREFIKLSVLTTGAMISNHLLYDNVELAWAQDPAFLKDQISDVDVKAMDIEIVFDTEIINPPKTDKPFRIWIPLSQSDFEQDITQLSVNSPVAFYINEERHYGNKMIYVSSESLKGGDKIEVKFRIHRKTVNIIEDKKEDIKKHLVPSSKEEWNEEIIEFADNVIGIEKDPLEIGRKIYYALIEFLTYDTKTVGCGPGISILTFENRGGRCADFHALFRSIMLYRGIPVRWRQGILIPYPSEKMWIGEVGGDCPGTHCWTEFYIGDGRWVPVDIVEGDQRKEMRDYFFGSLSPNRFNISKGRDIILNPPQEGEPLLNTFPITYGEYDGIPLIYGHHYRNNIRYKVLNVEV